MRRYDRSRQDAPGRSSGATRRPDRAGTTAHDRGNDRPTADGIGPEGLAQLQRAAGNAGVAALLGGSATDTAEEVLAEPGRPLDGEVRGPLESAFGADFSTVRVHDGDAAAASADALGARAYTAGENVVLGEGGSDAGTLAHELAHVVQQRTGPVDGSPTGAGLDVSDPGDRFERAADATAHAVLGGLGAEADHGGGAGAASTSVQRAVLGATGEATIQRAAPDDEEIPTVNVEDLPSAIPTVNVEDLPSAIPTVNVEDLPKAGGQAGGGGGGAGPASTIPSVNAQEAGQPAVQQVGPVTIEGGISQGALAAQAEVIRDDLANALDAITADPPDYKGAVTSMRDGGDESTELRDKVKDDPAAHDLATFVMDTFYIVGKDIWPKAGLAGKSSDATDAIQLERARVQTEKLADRLKEAGR